MKRLDATEHQHQAAVCQWLRLKGIRFYSVPNALKIGGIKLMAYLKAEGLSAGVPDLVVPYRNKAYGGLYLEMKKEGGRVKPEQKEWHEFLRSQGYYVEVCYSAEEAIATVTAYMARSEKWQSVKLYR